VHIETRELMKEFIIRTQKFKGVAVKTLKTPLTTLAKREIFNPKTGATLDKSKPLPLNIP
jgi:hypothetical protein